ncbi:MAG: RagB/SusD family nutrient uptake outer membrane protein [Bacteroidales bacterium]|nr:RagB/SusD family nutrient uptake outer membrane protein [Bacteroidales bacterium]
MKKLIYIIASVLLASCVNDLDTLPLNKTEPVSEYVYGKDENAYLSGLGRLYFQFVTNDLTDLQQMDGGASEIIRAFWSVQETTTDEAKCSWENDAWVRALNTNTWSETQNDAVYAVYVRTLQGIALVNEYLRQTAPERLEARGVSADLARKIDSFRDEARFIRAYLYWMAIDCFGSVPFTTEKSPFGGAYFPQQASRADIFDFCVNELTYLMSDESDMPLPRSNYPRADKGSAAGLLARMYLNSEVYTGVERWAEAKAVCEGIFGMGYTLCPDYAALFRGDNGENLQARGEMLWTVDYNAEKTQSYGGSSYILSATLASTDITDESRPNGQRNGWAGLRVPYEFVSRYFDVSGQDYRTGAYDVADKRGDVFYIKGRQESMENALYSFMNGWSCLKFNNIPFGQTNESYLPQSALKSFADVDFPMIRLGEIYLIYAEACMHLGAEGMALPKLRELSSRAGVEPPQQISQEFLVAERARELMWEAHRRTDLIRYGLFHTDAYRWPYKGGDSYAGQSFPEYKCIFPIPPTELATNDKLVQNPGYAMP